MLFVCMTDVPQLAVLTGRRWQAPVPVLQDGEHPRDSCRAAHAWGDLVPVPGAMPTALCKACNEKNERIMSAVKAAKKGRKGKRATPGRASAAGR
jgi:hypothetical protein